MEIKNNGRPKDWCKKCQKLVFLNEKLRAFRNGTIHSEGRCDFCGGFVKFVALEDSQLKQEAQDQKLASHMFQLNEQLLD